MKAHDATTPAPGVLTPPRKTTPHGPPKKTARGKAPAPATRAMTAKDARQLAAAIEWAERLGLVTISQARVVLAIAEAQDETPHTLASLVQLLKIPFSTASRLVWALTPEGGDVGVVRYCSHPTDRRKKQLRVTAGVALDVMRALAGTDQDEAA